jgi:hypothetical protein
MLEIIGVFTVGLIVVCAALHASGLVTFTFQINWKD